MKVKLASNLKRIIVKRLDNGRLLVKLFLFDVNSNMWDDTIIFELNGIDDFNLINKAYKNAIKNRPLAREGGENYLGGY